MAGNQSRTIYTNGGDYREVVNNKGTYVEGNYYISPETKPNLAEAAAEIQQLLKQLEQTYSPNTTAGKMQLATEAVKQIEANPTWKRRVVSALKAGGIAALDSALDHPAASFLIEAVKDWQATKPE